MLKNSIKKIMIIIGIMLLMLIIKSPISKAGTIHQVGENVTAVLDDQGTLTISGTGAISNQIAPLWKDQIESIKKVVIKNGVTSIKSYAFLGCIGLTQTTIPSSVTSIGEGAFAICLNLSEIKVEETNTKYASENGILFNKEKTKVVTYPAGKKDIAYVIPKGVTSVEAWAFTGCSSLTQITIPKGVTNIGAEAFSRCSSLKQITIPEGVTKIEIDTFFDCSSLTQITIPKGVTSIGGMAFSRCSSLTQITIPEGVTRIGGSTFDGCSSLTQITIPEGVTSIGEFAFSDCSSLKQITIPKGVTSIGEFAFYNCNKLIVLTLKGSYTDTYCKDNNINRITYSTMNWTNKNVDIELNGNKKYTFTKNGETTIKYVYINYGEAFIENALVKVTWIDKEVPVISGLTAETTNPNATLTVKATDKKSGLASKAYSWDGKKTWKTSKTFVVSENGTYTVYVKDRAGNIASKEIKISNISKTGDINDDKKIDITDLLVLKRHIVSGNKKAWKLTDKKLLLADINKDGKIDVTDLLLLKRHIVSGSNEKWKIK